MFARIIATLILLITMIPALGAERTKYNFNYGWLEATGDFDGAEMSEFNDSDWRAVTLPRAFNEDEAFRLSIEQLTDTVAWYRKHFKVPGNDREKVFVEFEGVRQGADFYLNGHKLGTHENGGMAVGFDLTPYLKHGDNLLAVRVDNNWDYAERATGTKYQWSNRNFNANYGGIPKNVYLHVVPEVYQTLPLYSNLGTTGVYIYASDFDIPRRSATINAESEVRNDGATPVSVTYRVTLRDADGSPIKTFVGDKTRIAPGQTAVLKGAESVDSLNFWSWGYGYLYYVDTELVDDNGQVIDKVTTRTGFRKTRFADGKIWLNDRVIQMHGYAQRTSNEWPGAGLSVPAWLSDYSNGLMVESGGNLVRWMHVTPWKQDVESCDRVGLIQAMPAGDAENDTEGRQWEQRVALMRDAIIYNRNNPSILFYESGNKGVSKDHMLEMKALRDKYDPYGGRASGSREMLDIDDAEYGGEMLYINRSAKHPMWAMEYCRDEGLRKYWDEWSYPLHGEGAGPLYRGKDASEYNHNQDMFAVELVRRWFDYWIERPGAGERCSSGGVKIVFSDTNTHYRGEENYRRSGVTDAMRIPKDGYYAHRVMWNNAWVDQEGYDSHIVGHWNYADSVVKPVYVISNADNVELTLNGKSLGKGRREYDFMFTFDNVRFEPGVLTAISRDTDGAIVDSCRIVTAGAPAAIKLSKLENPEGFKADGADMALIQVEIVDSEGNRCPLDNRMINFAIDGPADWRGGIAQGHDNYILSKSLPVECGVNRGLIRSTTEPGEIVVKATAEGLPPATLTLVTTPVEVTGGLSEYLPQLTLKGRLDRGPAPLTPSYKERLKGVAIKSASAGSRAHEAPLSWDDNERSSWHSDGTLPGSWIRYELEREAEVSDIVMKLAGWRSRSYQIEVLAGNEVVWSGDTPKSLGYIHITPDRTVKSDNMTIRLKGASSDGDAFGMTELGGGKANGMDSASKGKHRLEIVEIEFLEP